MRHGLGVLHQGGAAAQAALDGKPKLDAWERGTAFQVRDQRRLLTGDVTRAAGREANLDGVACGGPALVERLAKNGEDLRRCDQDDLAGAQCLGCEQRRRSPGGAFASAALGP